MRIAVVGAGISGIVAAHTLTKCGHEVIVFEKSNDAGGVWALGYPGVKLQNTENHYHFSDLPWPFQPDRHPTSAQIRKYLLHCVEELKLDIRAGQEVVALLEDDKGWLLKYINNEGEQQEVFEFILVAIGQYTEGKHKPEFPGQELYKGEVLTERDVGSLDVFDDKIIAVVGFGKSAVDMATFAVERAKQVYHVFRTPRWLVPFYILGVHYTHIMFCRMGTVIMPSWAYPSRFERLLHEKLSFIVNAIWRLNEWILSFQCKSQGRGLGKEAAKRLETVLPEHPMVNDLRSAAAMAPENYFQNVAEGKILPCHSKLDGFTESGLLLKDGTKVECDQVLLCLGSETPVFPFFPDKYRQILEAENDGIQLYRHLLHPRIPKVAFAGFNHGFMHVPSVEVAMVWLSAYLNNEIQIPSTEDMETSMQKVLEWKRQHIHYEPSRSCAVNTRFQQYIDIILKDPGISPYRKMPNVFAELFVQYGASDYKDVLADYKRSRETTKLPLKVLPLDT
jgi:hypothetical protein